MPRKIKTTKKTSKSAVNSTVRIKNIEMPAKAPINEMERKIGGMSVKVHRSTFIISLAILVVGALLYFGRGFIVAAVVNGQPISRVALVQEAEKQSGKQALSGLIRNILVEQEARKQNVTITEKQIDDQIKIVETNLSKQGQNLDQMLTLEGMTRQDLRRVIRLDLLVTKMVEKSIKVTDKEVNDYIEKNKDILPKDQSASELKKTVLERLKQQSLSQKAQEWLAGLEKNAKIVKFVNY